MKKYKAIKYALLGLLLLPVVATAQGGALVPQPPAVLAGSRLGDRGLTITNLILYFINIVLLIVGLIAVAFLIYGGFRYITSAGNDEVAEGAKKAIQNAIIGLVITILSYVIVTVISNALLGNT